MHEIGRAHHFVLEAAHARDRHLSTASAHRHLKHVGGLRREELEYRAQTRQPTAPGCPVKRAIVPNHQNWPGILPLLARGIEVH